MRSPYNIEYWLILSDSQPLWDIGGIVVHRLRENCSMRLKMRDSGNWLVQLDYAPPYNIVR